MSESEPETGATGEQGIQGVQGIQGTRGLQGSSTGKPGKTGARGKAGKSATRPFILLMLVALIVTVFGVYQNSATRSLAKKNTEAIRRIKTLEAETLAFRRARLKVTTATDILICTRVEALKTIIRQVVVPTRAQLLAIPYYRQHTDQVQAAIDSGKATAARFGPQNCRALPSAKPAPVPK